MAGTMCLPFLHRRGEKGEFCESVWENLAKSKKVLYNKSYKIFRHSYNRGKMK